MTGSADADERLREQYEVEKELAHRLKSATKAERRGLYKEVYDELFRRLGDHPQMAHSADAAARRQEVALQATLLEPFLTPDDAFLEVGAGDCALSLEMANRARHVTAVDASSEITAGTPTPSNFSLVLADGPPLPLDDGSVQLAYSCHFIEHLHPEDALDHAADMRRVLAVGGRYICVTPNRLLGPHDISRHFDDVATGLHLKEYGFGDLARLLRAVGFGRVRALAGIGVEPRPSGLLRYRLAEGAFGLLPRSARIRLLERLAPGAREPFRPLEQVVVVGER
jgi:ubiquinone/menaquinone biosynthesis C-methylase UbiE